MSGNEKVVYFGVSDLGCERTNNEDAFVVEHLDENTILAVVIDGVGGYEGGEVAARIAQQEIPRYLRTFRNGEPLELLKQAVTCANNSIYAQRQTDTMRSQMSCVLTSVIIDMERKIVSMVHVGDTRLYQYYNGILQKLSHDHSLIGYREEIGDLTEEQAMHHPQRNVISRVVGSEPHEISDMNFLESTEFPLSANSVLLLCSDGLTDLVTSQQIMSVLQQDIPLEEKSQALVNSANKAGGKDNVTVVLVEYIGAPDMPDKVNVAESRACTQNDTEMTIPRDIKTSKKNKRILIAAIILFVLTFLSALFVAYMYLKTNN